MRRLYFLTAAVALFAGMAGIAQAASPQLKMTRVRANALRQVRNECKSHDVTLDAVVIRFCSMPTRDCVRMTHRWDDRPVDRRYYIHCAGAFISLRSSLKYTWLSDLSCHGTGWYWGQGTKYHSFWKFRCDEIYFT